MSERRRLTWSAVFWRYLRQGYDHSYAAYRADEWERRQKTIGGNRAPS